jgi:hypothetical protein
MTKFLKNTGLVIAGVVVGLLFSAVVSSLEPSTLGGVYNQVNNTFREGIKVGTSDQFSVTSAGALTLGTSGTTHTQVIATTCNLIGTNGSQNATTSAAYDCAVTGVTPGDLVFGSLNSATGATNNGRWAIASTKASTTAGYVTFVVVNNTGAAAVPSTSSVGSSTQVLIIR